MQTISLRKSVHVQAGAKPLACRLMTSQFYKPGLCIWVLATAAIVQASGTFAINNWRYRTFRVAGPLDTAYYNQQLWNFWHANSPITIRPQNSYAIEGPEPWKTNHLRPVTAVIGLVYPLWSGVPLFYFLQSVAMACGVWPAYHIGRRIAEDANCGIVAGLMYATAPIVWLLGTGDFRYLHLGIPLVLWTFDALDRRRPVEFAVSTSALFCTRESFCIVLAMLGISQLVRRRPWAENLRWACAAGAIGVAWFWIHFGYLAWAFGRETAAGYLEATRDPVSAYGRNPGHMIDDLGRESVRLALVAGPMAAASVAAPELMVPGIVLGFPPLHMGLFTLHPAHQYVRYLAPAGSVLLVAAVVSLSRLWRRWSNCLRRRRAMGISAILIFTAGTSCVLFGPAGVLRIPSRLAHPNDVTALRNALQAIPADAAVLAYRAVLPNLSSRTKLFDYHQLPPEVTLENAIDQSRWIIVERLVLVLVDLDRQAATDPASQAQLEWTLAQMEGRGELSSAAWRRIVSGFASSGVQEQFQHAATLQSVVVLRRTDR